MYDNRVDSIIISLLSLVAHHKTQRLRLRPQTTLALDKFPETEPEK
jgi:hypothetical protein